MLAMIALDKKDGMLFIAHHEVNKLKLVKDDKEAEAFIRDEFDNCVLLGTFPDPSSLVNIVLKERDNAKRKDPAKKAKKAAPRS